MQVWKWAKKIWELWGNFLSAKELLLFILGPTLVAGLGSAFLAWLFAPASPIDLLVVALVFGLLAFLLARRFAPKLIRELHVLHTEALPFTESHTHTLLKEASGAQSTLIRKPGPYGERDTGLIDALLYAMDRVWDSARPLEPEIPLMDFHQRARDGTIRVWGKTRACPQLVDSQAGVCVIPEWSADSELTNAALRPS
jgi:hypothetical protein